MNTPRYKTPRDPRQGQLLDDFDYGPGIHPDAPAGGGGLGRFTSMKPYGDCSVIAFHSHTGPQDAREADWVMRMNRSFAEAERGARGELSEDLWGLARRTANLYRAYLLARDKYAVLMIQEETGRGLKEILEGLIPGLLMALIVVVGSTGLGGALGAAIGFLFGGVGAGPGAGIGAELGFDAGLWLLNWMGIGFLIVYVGKHLLQVLNLVRLGVVRAWNAGRGAKSEQDDVEEAGRDLARALGVLFRLILEGIVLYLLAKGLAAVTSRLEELIGSLKKSRFGKGFTDWIEKNYQSLIKDPRFNGGERANPGENHPSPEKPGAARADGGRDSKARSEGRGKRALPLKPGSGGVRNVRLDKINYSQARVSPNAGDGTPIKVMAEDMKNNGWDREQGYPDMVEYPDGRILTVDHRRLVAADQAGMEEVPANVHLASEEIDEKEAIKRFTLKIGFTDPETGRVYNRGDIPANWGEAAMFRCANQRVMGYPDFPIEGSPNLPEISNSKRR